MRNAAALALLLLLAAPACLLVPAWLAWVTRRAEPLPGDEYEFDYEHFT